MTLMRPLKAIPGYDHILMCTMTMHRVQKAWKKRRNYFFNLLHRFVFDIITIIVQWNAYIELTFYISFFRITYYILKKTINTENRF